MKITLYPTDEGFEVNLDSMRWAVINQQPYAPTSMLVFLDGHALHDAKTVHVRADGWIAYSDSGGERRVERGRVGCITAHFA